MEDDLRRLIALAPVQDALLATFELDCVCQQFARTPSGAEPWTPLEQPTRVHALVDDRDHGAPGRRFRADYRPEVNRWINGAAPFCFTNHTVISDGHQTRSYRAEHPSRPSIYQRPGNVHLTGERFLLCRFGRRTASAHLGPLDSEPLQLARSLLEPNRPAGRGAVEREAAAWATLPDGRRTLRMEQTFPGGGGHVYWLDPERGYALLRFDEAVADGEPATLFEVEDLCRVATDFWYPARVSSRALNPSPWQTRPVPVDPGQLPANLPSGAGSGEVTCWRSSRKAGLPEEFAGRWTFEFSNVRVGVAVPADAFEFRPPTF